MRLKDKLEKIPTRKMHRRITLRSISTQNTPDTTITNPDPPDFLINGQIVGVV